MNDKKPYWVFDKWCQGIADIYVADDDCLDLPKLTRAWHRVIGEIKIFLFGWWWYVDKKEDRAIELEITTDQHNELVGLLPMTRRKKWGIMGGAYLDEDGLFEVKFVRVQGVMAVCFQFLVKVQTFLLNRLEEK